MKHLISLIIALTLTSCAGVNPNLGERTADVLWNKGDTAAAHDIIQEKAIKGYPWAQLRLGLMYEKGVAVEKSIPKAAEWYKKVIAQKSSGGWAEGVTVGSTGKEGYFNQNNDARIAEYRLANIYLMDEGIPRDAKKATLMLASVIRESGGNDIFYCCEFSGGEYLTAEQLSNAFTAAQTYLTKEEMLEVKKELGL